MNCSNCGHELEPDQTSCPACGALTIRDDPIWQAARADDPPTEVIPVVRPPVRSEPTAIVPAVARPEPPRAPRPQPSAQPVPASGPEPTPEPEPASEPEPTPEPAPALAPEPRHAPARRPFTMGAAVGGLVVIVLAAVLVASGGLAGLLQSGGGPSKSGDADPTGVAASPGGASPQQPPQGFSCSPVQVAAPGAGRWRLFRAEFGQRDRSDYLRLKLGRDGNHEQAAAATAEVVPVSEVASRFGVEPPPGGDVALVVAFTGPVVIGGPWNANAGYRALRELKVTRGNEGRVYVVASVSGQGCFSLSGGAWDTGQMNNENDVTLEIQRQ